MNEVIGSSIARLTGAPTSESVLIDVEPDFLAISKLPGVPAGLHFGSKCIVDLIGPAKAMIPLVSNTHQFAHVITSDVVTNDSDRNNAGNFLIRVVADNPRRLEFIAIDFGHCFGHTWDESIVNQTGWCGNMLRKMNSFIDGEQPFAEPVKICKEIPQGTVEAIVDAIPSSWNLTAPKSTAIREYLLKRLNESIELLETHEALPELDTERKREAVSKLTPFKYAVVQFHRNPLRGEPFNLGLLVVSMSVGLAKFKTTSKARLSSIRLSMELLMRPFSNSAMRCKSRRLR